MTGVRLEVCVDTVAGLHSAVAGGADRVELCAALELGGLSPTPGLIHAAAQVNIPVYCMIRPRPGDFVFAPDEVDQMRADIAAVRHAGLAGVVLGASTRTGLLDQAMLANLREDAQGLGATLHRVVDTLQDRLTAVTQAIDIGFDTILSSGGARGAAEAPDALAKMVQQADGRLEIMPGSGVNAQNCTRLLRATGAHWLHASCSSADPMPRRLSALGFCKPTMLHTDRAKVRELADKCHGFAG